MSSKMRARLTSDKVSADGTFTALAGFRVVLKGPEPLFGNGELATDTTRDSGHFEFSYSRAAGGPPTGSTTPPRPRRLALIAYDVAGRVLPISSTHQVSLPISLDGSGAASFTDPDDDQIVEGDFIVREVDARGLAVTLGQAAAERLSDGNAVTALVDKDVFSHAAARFQAATKSILLTQLTFSLPPQFQVDPALEKTKVVIAFHPPIPDAAHRRATDPDDVRPERLLLQRADAGVNVRILLHKFRIPLWLKTVIGALVFPFAGSDGVSAAFGRIVDGTSSNDEAQAYFGPAGRPRIKAQPFEQSLTNMGVFHARLAIVDSDPLTAGTTEPSHAICMGASIAQGYVDTPAHAIDAPIRGASEGLPNHDAAVGITGPAVEDLHKTMAQMWSATGSTDPFPTLSSVPVAQTSGGEAISSIQIVRTLSEDRFAGLDEGEKGILEGYLRAIADAEDFIYIENQYFTNDRIGEALVKVMKARRARPGKPDLQVIVVLNIAPDVPTYPCKQRRLITRIRRAVGETPGNPKQFGVFTRWAHDGPPRPRMLPVYVHSKIAMVDDKWATVGSANLDGLSLDSNKIGDVLNFILPGDPLGEQRAVEVNALLFKDRDGSQSSEIAAILRRKLWAEHLNFTLASGEPNPAAVPLQTPGVNGWLALWNSRAQATLQQLQNTPAQPLTDMAKLLPWPPDNSTHDSPRDHLKSLGINPHRVLPLKSTRAFDFKGGDWRKGSSAKVDS